MTGNQELKMLFEMAGKLELELSICRCQNPSLVCLAEQVRICAYLAWFPRIASAEATALERRRSLASGLLKTEAHLRG